MRIIEENLQNDNFSTEVLASELGVGKTQFHRKLKALTNQSSTSFIRNVRLNTAKKMIDQGNESIREVSFKVGYDNIDQFVKAYSSYFGSPPAENGSK